MKNKNKANEEIIYKCIYNRKDEANRQKLHLGAFCYATLKAKIGVRLNTKGYIISITKNHSNECLSLIKSNVINNNETINQFIDFKNKVFSMLNDINIYDRKDCKNKIQAIYNNNKYDFQLKKSTINNIIQKWKNNSIKFTKYQCLENPYDNEKELYLREYRVKYIFIENKENIIPIEYFIWANDVNIAHIRKSKNIFFDATFHVPYGFSQCLILLYKDIITGEKYPGIYTVMNKKNYIIYKLVLESINNILTQDKLYNLEIETITTDAEAALLKAIKIIFKPKLNFICLYHFKKDLITQLKIEGLYKKNNINDSKKIVNELTKLSIEYDGNIEYVKTKINNIKEKYSNYINFIDNYFMKNKLKFFISGEINYRLLPLDCRTNSSLENYNKIMKESLGKNRYIHWINYINFINSESTRIKNKIYKNLNQNIVYNSKFTKFGLNKYIKEQRKIEENNTIKDIKKYEKNLLGEENNLNINNWLTNNMNSCRYDAFLTIYGFILKDKIRFLKVKFTDNMTILDSTFEQLYDTPTNNVVINFWNYCNQEKIDPVPVGKEGFIYELFKLFPKNESFCILEKINNKCDFCYYNNIKDNPTINIFVQINPENLLLSGIEETFKDKYSYKTYLYCPNCQNNIKEKEFKRCSVEYSVKSFPNFLFILFDMDYNQLKNNKIDIIKFSSTFIQLNVENKYYLIGGICIPFRNHYNCFIYNYNSDLLNYGLEKGKNYIHDGLKNLGNFEEFTDLIKYFEDNIPYILIYYKK